MHALILNCTLKLSPAASNTEALARVLSDALEERGATCEMIRAVDLALLPGVSSDEGEGDEWPEVHAKLLSSETSCSPRRPGSASPRASSSASSSAWTRCSLRPPATGRPVAFDRVAGFVVTGNEDGAHHVIAELAQAVNDIGYTVPAQAWTYWNKGPGPGPTYLETDEGHEWSYCIERELLTWRRLRFPHGVDVGDIVVFPNTAGYLMHILESASHQIPLARNLVVGATPEPFLDPIDSEIVRPLT